ncbi:MAG: UbiA prenyltransferase family protein [Candidatus Thermoplasmatota archaeon]|nr:UbiA prenyltransferase family protein [Candidatus Thermoplasmatota archaeon]
MIHTLSLFTRLIRPIAWIVFLFPFAIGFSLSVTPGLSLNSILLGFLSFVGVMCFGFTVNALGDIHIDQFHDGHSKDMNLSKQPLVTGELTPKKAWYLTFGFLVFSLITSYYVNFLFCSSIIILIILGFIYSIPPIRLKVRPGMDILCNASLGMMFFTAGTILGDTLLPFLIYIGVFFMAATFYIPTVVTDFEFDQRAGAHTSAVTFGPGRIVTTMLILTTIIVIISSYMLLTESLEIQILASIMLIYSLVFTSASQLKLRNNHWVIHENWILVPFGLISVLSILYGILKVYGILQL